MSKVERYDGLTKEELLKKHAVASQLKECDNMFRTFHATSLTFPEDIAPYLSVDTVYDSSDTRTILKKFFMEISFSFMKYPMEPVIFRDFVKKNSSKIYSELYYEDRHKNLSMVIQNKFKIKTSAANRMSDFLLDKYNSVAMAIKYLRMNEEPNDYEEKFYVDANLLNKPVFELDEIYKTDLAPGVELSYGQWYVLISALCHISEGIKFPKEYVYEDLEPFMVHPENLSSDLMSDIMPSGIIECGRIPDDFILNSEEYIECLEEVVDTKSKVNNDIGAISYHYLSQDIHLFDENRHAILDTSIYYAAHRNMMSSICYRVFGEETYWSVEKIRWTYDEFSYYMWNTHNVPTSSHIYNSEKAMFAIGLNPEITFAKNYKPDTYNLSVGTSQEWMAFAGIAFQIAKNPYLFFIYGKRMKEHIDLIARRNDGYLDEKREERKKEILEDFEILKDIHKYIYVRFPKNPSTFLPYDSEYVGEHIPGGDMSKEEFTSLVEKDGTIVQVSLYKSVHKRGPHDARVRMSSLGDNIKLVSYNRGDTYTIVVKDIRRPNDEKG